RAEARHDQVTALERALVALVAEGARARVPAEVVELVARGRQLRPADDPAVGRRAGIAVDHGHGVALPSGRIERRDVGELLWRGRGEPDGDGPVGPTRMLLTKPVIAAVEGHAVAGGLELAAWCDLRVAAEDAVFGVYCRRWGIPLMDGGTIRLARLIGHSNALDLILTGRGVSGEEALRMGLANRLVPAGHALE